MPTNIKIARHQAGIRLHIEEPGPEPDLTRTKDLDLPLLGALMLAAQITAECARLIQGAAQKAAKQAENKPQNAPPPETTPDADGVS